MKALDGVRVIEVAGRNCAPYCGKLLADLGAEVIKVEPPHGGDGARRHGPFPKDEPHLERGGLFQYHNTNKKSVTLDITSRAGKRLFHRLVQWAEVLVEDHLPKDAKSLGLDFETLHTVSPRLVVTSITPFGQTGPHANYKAYHLNVCQAGVEGSQIPAIQEHLPSTHGLPPVQIGGDICDADGGLFAGMATVAALYGGGVGQHVDVSQQQVEMNLNRLTFSALFGEGGIVYDRYSRDTGSGSMVPCKDGYASLSFSRDYFYDEMVRSIGMPELAEDPRFKLKADRLMNMTELRRLVSQGTMKYTKRELYYLMMSIQCPSGFYAEAEDLVNSPQMKARGFFADVQTHEAGVVKMPLPGYKMSATPPGVESPAPRLGQHNREVFCGILSITPQELARLRGAGVV